MNLLQTIRYGAALWIMGATTFAIAQPIQLAGSKINATYTQMGVAVDVPFKRFTGTVKYDPAAPEKALADLSVDVSSFDLGDPLYNAEMLKSEWFAAEKYPQARFVSHAVRAVGVDKLHIDGTLTIKGLSKPLQLVAAVVPQDGGYLFSGAIPISRLGYRIGEGEWFDTDLIGDAVQIHFRLLTQP